MTRRVVHRLSIAIVGLCVFASVASAHGGGIGGGRPDPLSIPTWLFLITGGGVIGASFLLASFVTDRQFIRYLHSVGQVISLPRRPLRLAGHIIGLGGLVALLVGGFLGPMDPLQNMAILLLWAGWWAGFTMTVYLGGNSWPAINPFRTLTKPFVTGYVQLPESASVWPAVGGLLLVIWIEVVSPLADDPRFLGGAVLVYGVVTVAGAVLFGGNTWFRNVDPVSCIFRQYGKVAPIQRTERGLKLTLPGNGLIESPASSPAEVGLIIALVWGTSYDGIVQTPLWRDVARAVVGAGVPAALLYPLVLVLGFGFFFAIFWAASRMTRQIAPTFLTTWSIARLFAPSLLAIAAGYHLAHYLSYFLSLAPALVVALASPLAPVQPITMSVPGWFAGLAIAFVLFGHLLAIWVAHSVAYEQFPSRVQAIRSQYPITLVMVFYTVVSLWIVTQPFVPPPYI